VHFFVRIESRWEFVDVRHAAVGFAREPRPWSDSTVEGGTTERIDVGGARHDHDPGQLNLSTVPERTAEPVRRLGHRMSK
jgi:hypothetical protein